MIFDNFGAFFENFGAEGSRKVSSRLISSRLVSSRVVSWRLVSSRGGPGLAGLGATGHILMSFWTHFGVILTSRALLGRSRVLLGDLGVIMSEFRCSGSHYGSILESFWSHFGDQKACVFETRFWSLFLC